MKYMLDTNICIYLIKQKPVGVVRRLQALHISDVSISSITQAELEYGVEKSERPEQNRWALTQFLAPLEILTFGDAAAQKYGRIRHRLEKSGNLIGSLDLLIAAHALSLGAVLVTNNAAEFRRVEGLTVENWI